MKKLITGAALAIVSTHPFITLANDKMEELIVTSSRIEMPLRQVATSVSIVTETDITNLGLSSLADVLSTQPSVGISTSGGMGTITAIRIRGEENFRTLVLVDGMDISDASGTQTAPHVENLLSAGISRVEILRGPQGMMYGADAGGIIDITSYVPSDGLGGQVSAEGGSYDTRQVNANLGGKGEYGDFSLSATDLKTNGYNSQDQDDVLRDDDGFENRVLHGRGAWNISETFRAQLVLRDTDADNDYDSCYNAGFSQVHLCKNTFEQTAARVSLDYAGKQLQHTLAAVSTETDREYFAEGIASYGGHGELEKYEYLGSYKASESTQLVYGADLKRESMEGSTETLERDQTGVYLEYQGSFADALFLTVGARYDDNDDFGDFTSYRLSAAYLVETSTGTLKVKSSYGTGFRAPSLFEISYNAQPRAWLPVPPAFEPLKQEESRGLDIGLEYFSHKGLHLEAVLFSQQVEDQITYDFDTDGYYQLGGDDESIGLELVLDAPIHEEWGINANYTYNDTENPSGTSRARRPKHMANIGVLYNHVSGRFTANLYARGSYDAIDFDGRDLDDYQVVNLSARFAMTDALELYGRIENLLDEDYQEIAGYNTSAAAGYAGIRYSF